MWQCTKSSTKPCCWAHLIKSTFHFIQLRCKSNFCLIAPFQNNAFLAQALIYFFVKPKYLPTNLTPFRLQIWKKIYYEGVHDPEEWGPSFSISPVFKNSLFWKKEFLNLDLQFPLSVVHILHLWLWMINFLSSYYIVL